MKTCISKLKPFCKKNVMNVVIETPQGSRGKYRYDEESGLFELSKIMSAGMEFPYDFGFVPGTKAPDGDPLDVLVFLNVCVPVGCLLRCRPIGVIEAKQTERNGKTTRNDRIVAVPVESHGNSHSDVKSLKEMNNSFKSTSMPRLQRWAFTVIDSELKSINARRIAGLSALQSGDHNSYCAS